jgi:AraC-like DNA-binding protein
MSLVYEERGSDSPLVETITHGYTVSDGSTIRPAEICWHLVLSKYHGKMDAMVVGPLTSAGQVSWGKDAEILWIKFKVGAFMPHLPVKSYLDVETLLPDASSQSFWLNGSAWRFPDFENADTFVDRLARQNVLVRDPVVRAAMQGHLQDVPSRTVRHRFLRATGLTQTHIRQFERAQRAATLLKQGFSILDTVEAAGYFDQPHLTRALKHWVGHTPAQIIAMHNPACHSIQDNLLVSRYDTDVLAKASQKYQSELMLEPA